MSGLLPGRTYVIQLRTLLPGGGLPGDIVSAPANLVAATLGKRSCSAAAVDEYGAALAVSTAVTRQVGQQLYLPMVQQASGGK